MPKVKSYRPGCTLHVQKEAINKIQTSRLTEEYCP